MTEPQQKLNLTFYRTVPWVGIVGEIPGHYQLEVSVRGPIDSETQMVANLTFVDKALQLVKFELDLLARKDPRSSIGGVLDLLARGLQTTLGTEILGQTGVVISSIAIDDGTERVSREL